MISVVRAKQPEKEVQRQGVALLKLMGFAVYNLSQARASKQTPGLADSFVCGRGVCAWFEWKKTGGTQSDAQKAFEADVTSNGGIYVLCDSVEDVAKWVNGLRERR